MTGWFAKATAVFRGPTTAQTIPFLLQCECGGTLQGIRLTSHQKVICSDCRRPTLVLPASPYPLVKRTDPEPPARRANTVVQPQEQPKKSQTTARSTADQKASSPKPVKPTVTEPPPPEGKVATTVVAPRGNVLRYLIRLVIVLMLALVGMTGWSLWNRSLKEQARSRIPAAAEAGMHALHEGNFVKAEQQLGISVRGLDILKRTDAESRALRQAYQEAQAGYQLSSVSLMKLADEYLADPAEDRLRTFQAHHGAKWLIFDASMIRVESENDVWYELDLPYLVHARPLNLRVIFPALSHFAAATGPSSPQRVIFAGQIEDWLVSDQHQKTVTAIIRSETAFLWTDPLSLRAVGLPAESPEADQELRELLSRQRQESLARE